MNETIQMSDKITEWDRFFISETAMRPDIDEIKRRVKGRRANQAQKQAKAAREGRDHPPERGVIYLSTSAAAKLLQRSEQTVRKMIEAKTIKGGMIPKIECALTALTKGVEKVPIINGKIRHALLLELFTRRGIGTEVIA